MNITYLRIFCCFLYTFIVTVSAAQSINLYISPNGNDTSDGSMNKPLASITGAQNKIKQLKKSGVLKDILVKIKSGEYFLQEPVAFNSSDGGSSQQKITYQGENTKPVFYGGKRIPGFQVVSKNLWRTYLPEVKGGSWSFEQLYVNGTRATRARTPNEGFYHPQLVTETIVEKGSGAVAKAAIQKITTTSAESSFLNQLPPKELNNAIISIYHKWDNTRKKITFYDAKKGDFSIKGTGMIPWNKMDEKSLFFIENTKLALDAPGEWFLENNTGYLYYYPKPNELINKTVFFAPVTDKFLTITGTSTNKINNLKFENISFQVAGFKMPDAGIEPVQAAATVDATIMVDFAENFSFNNCEILHTGLYSLWFQRNCINCKVTNSVLSDMGAGGIKIGEINHDPNTENTKQIVVDNNIIQHGGYVFPCGVGIIIFTASDNQITHNDIADFRYSGISVGWVWGDGESYSKRNNISFNQIHHLGWGVLSDMGGIYTLGHSEGTTITNNVLHDVYSNDYGGWGIYNDEGSAGITIKNNLIYNCKSAAYNAHFSKNNEVSNNIFYNQIETQLETNSGDTPDGFKFTNNIISFSRGTLSNYQWDKNKFSSDFNIYWDSSKKPLAFGEKNFQQWQASGKDRNSIVDDPMFANPNALNFAMGNKNLINKISFHPFNYNVAGVYGSTSWKAKAVMSNAIITSFQK